MKALENREVLILLKSVRQRADGGKSVKLSELELKAFDRALMTVEAVVRQEARR